MTPGDVGSWIARHLTPRIFACLAVFAGLSVMMLTGTTLPWDDAVLRWIGAHRTPGLVDAALVASFIADGTTIAILGLGTCVLLWRLSTRRAAFALLIAGVIGELVYVVAKASFGRDRPEVIEKLGSAGWLSYPSGHTMMAVVILAFAMLLLGDALPRWRWAFRGVAVAVALAVAASRVVLGVHYPSDVLAGLTLGGAWMFFWLDWSRRPTPVPSPGR